MKDGDLDQHLRDWARSQQPSEFTDYSLRARVLEAVEEDEGDVVSQRRSQPMRRRTIAISSLAALLVLSLTPLLLLPRSTPSQPETSQSQSDPQEQPPSKTPPQEFESLQPSQTRNTLDSSPQTEPWQTAWTGTVKDKEPTPPDEEIVPPRPETVPLPVPNETLVVEEPAVPQIQTATVQTRAPHQNTVVLNFNESDRKVRDLGEVVAKELASHLVAKHHSAGDYHNLTALPLHVRGHLLNTIANTIDTPTLVTGSVSLSKNTLYLRALVTDRDTHQERGYVVSGPREKGTAPLVKILASQIENAVPNTQSLLVAKPTPVDRLAALREMLRNRDQAQVRVAGMAVRSQYYASLDKELTGLLNDSGFFQSADEHQGGYPPFSSQREPSPEFARFRYDLARIRLELQKQPAGQADEKIARDLRSTLSDFFRGQIDDENALQTTSQELANRLLPKLSKEAP